MASWFDSVSQSIGNFVSGHGFEDNAQKAIIDAQNEKKRREEQQAALNKPIVQPKPIQQPQTPNGLLAVPSINTPSRQAINQPIVQQPTQVIQKPIVVNNSALTGAPVAPTATITKPSAPQVQIQPAKPSIDYSNPLTFAGEWGKEWLKTAGNGINNFIVKPFVNTAKAAGDIVAGGISRVTGNDAMTKRADTAFTEHWNGSIPGAMTNWIAPLGTSIAYNEQYNKITKDPNTSQNQKDWLLANLTNSMNQETAKAGANTEQPTWQNALNIGLGAASLPLGMVSLSTSLDGLLSAPAKYIGNAETKVMMNYLNREPGIMNELVAASKANDTTAFRIAANRIEFPNTRQVLLDMADNADIAGTTKISAGTPAIGSPTIPSTTSPVINNVLPITPTTPVTPTVPTMVQPTAPQVTTAPITTPQLSLPENTLTMPTISDVFKSDGPGGFVTKTPQQVTETTKVIGEIKKIDNKLNIIRQGKTNNLTAPEVRSLIQQRDSLLSVASGDSQLAGDAVWNNGSTDQAIKITGIAGEKNGRQYVNIEGSKTAVPLDEVTLNSTDLGNPGAVPTDGTITANPTNADLANIVENTQNPTAPRTPKIKLTPQNEMPGVSQKPVDNFTGELGVNKNGQIYQKVDQAAAKDTALKNLLDGKTPEEYLATAQQTGQADSAELAILMQQVPKDSQIWAELASMKGKLGTQKGQALALLEKTIRQTATSEQLASRTLQKANTAGFDTTQIAGEISNINKKFTDARDAYNAVLNTPGSTNAEVQAAKDAFYKVTKQSFTDESNILSKLAKTKEQKNFAYQLQKKSDVYLQGMATSSLTSSPASVMRNFSQGVGALAHQAGLAPKVEALINRAGGGDKIGSFDAAGAKVGLRTGANNLKSEFATRSSQLGLTKNPLSWVKHPIGTIRQLTTTGTELGNIPMEAGIRGGMSSEYKQILKAQGYKGEELKNLTERNTITDPLNIRDKYAKEINDLNGLSSEIDRTGGTFRDNIKNQFTKGVPSLGIPGVTDKTAYQLADFIDRDIFGFFKPTLIVGKKTADYATGGVAHLVPAIVKLSRGDKAGFVNEISKLISTAGVTLPVLGATGYALAKSGVLTQNEYGEWEINNVPISGYVGAFGGPLAMGAIVGENQANDRPAFDGFADKAYKTITNTYPYGQAGQKLGAVADVAGGIFGDITSGQQAYGVKEGVASLLGGLGKMAIPASSFLNWINKMLGGNVKDTVVDNPKDATVLDAGVAGVKQAGNQIINGVPIASNMLPDKKNSFGDTMSKPDPISAFFGASNDSIAQSDKATGITAVGSKGLNKVAKTNLTTVDEKTAYNDIVKRLEDNGDSVSDTNVAREFVKDGNPLLASKYDKTINTSIDDADKIALAKYNVLDSDHQKVYIQDQQKALETYTAQLNNKQSNDTLTEDDKKTYKVWSGSGNSLLVNALVAKTNVEHKVSTDTLNLYEQVTTQKEYNNLSTEQKTAIDTYATQLKANGVNVRSFLSGSGSGSTAKGASSISLGKAVTSGSGGSGKFAHQDINVDIPQVVKPAPQYVIKQRKISVG